MRILNAAQMRAADRRTIDEIGLPSIVLMENAGRQVVAAMEATFDDLNESRVAILCGKGSNGGDGLVVARTLAQRGIDVSVFVVARLADIRGDARVNLDIIGRLGLTVVEITDEGQWDLHMSEIATHDLIVDALFGTGLTAGLTGIYETIVADVNDCPLPVVSIDLPSGVSADTSELVGHSIDAALTVTLGAPKLPLVLPPAEARAGTVVVADIGIPESVIEEVTGPRVELLTRERMRALVTPRAADAHKGDFGRVLIVAGSRGKSGAAVLAGLGALKSGSGLVTLAVPRSAWRIVAAFTPEYMTEPLVQGRDGALAPAAVDTILTAHADVLAIGPGLGISRHVRDAVQDLVRRGEGPLVIDADALNAFAGEPAALTGRDGRPVIITPHPGEMARLMGCSSDEVQANRLGMATEFATRHQVYVVLKGYRTLIATPDGKVFINPTGTPGMATGGTGDVLTGMIAAWLAQLLDAEAACRLAVYLHGAAGELAESDHGEVSLTAMDLVDHIGDAVLELTARRRVVPTDE